MRIRSTCSLRPGACLAKPVHDSASTPPDPVTTMSISSIPKTPGGPVANLFADKDALKRSPFTAQVPEYENVVSPPLNVPSAWNSTTPAPSPTGVLNQTEYLPGVIN